MNSEDFQSLILKELKMLNTKFEEVNGRIDELDGKIVKLDGRIDELDGIVKLDGKVDKLDGRVDRLEIRVDRLEERQIVMEKRQNEIYQVVRAIEHSNEIGKSEIDEQRYKVSKHEGTFKKIAKVIDEEITVSNL